MKEGKAEKQVWTELSALQRQVSMAIDLLDGLEKDLEPVISLEVSMTAELKTGEDNLVMMANYINSERMKMMDVCSKLASIRQRLEV